MHCIPARNHLSCVVIWFLNLTWVSTHISTTQLPSQHPLLIAQLPIQIEFKQVLTFSLVCILLLVRGFYVLPYRLHKVLILSHLLKSLSNILNQKNVWETGTQLQEILQVSMFFVLLPNASFFKQREKVICLYNIKRYLFVFSLYVLLVYCRFKELYGCHIVL